MDIFITRFCGRIFGDFRGVHSMLLCARSACVSRDESSRRESRKKGRVGMHARTPGDPREGTLSPGKEMRHRRQVIVGGKMERVGTHRKFEALELVVKWSASARNFSCAFRLPVARCFPVVGVTRYQRRGWQDAFRCFVRVARGQI